MANAETHRPRFHFTPEKMWLNDPNGLVYADGEYHLFYQYEPNALTCTGIMDWGHAVSRDLIHWQHLPIAITHDENGYAWSGSAVLDRDNSSGLGSAQQPPLVAIYTQHLKLSDTKATEQQAIAFSLDKGRNWTKYGKNPVIENPGNPDFRDPKVFWHKASKRWIAVIASQFQARFYRSRDLKTWEACGFFDSPKTGEARFWECPDLFPIRVRGTDRVKWVLLHNNWGGPNKGTGTKYYVGQFDGSVFISDYPVENDLWLEYGPDNYAGITWDNAPDERRILIGWMSNWAYAQSVPTETWRGAMTVPRELWLEETPEGARLFQEPVPELQSLRKNAIKLPASIVETMKPLPEGVGVSEMELTFDLKKTRASGFGVELSNSKGESVRIGYDKGQNRFIIDRTKSGKIGFHEKYAAMSRPTAPRESKDPFVRMRLLMDAASVELFADNGRTVMTAVYFPNEDFGRAALYSESGSAAFTGGSAWRF